MKQVKFYSAVDHWADLSCDPVVEHCLNGFKFEKHLTKRFVAVLNVHNIEPVFQTTLTEGAKTIYRVDDGEQLFLGKDGFYYFQNGNRKYSFEELRSHFGRFTTEESEIGLKFTDE